MTLQQKIQQNLFQRFIRQKLNLHFEWPPCFCHLIQSLLASGVTHGWWCLKILHSPSTYDLRTWHSHSQFRCHVAKLTFVFFCAADTNCLGKGKGHSVS